MDTTALLRALDDIDVAVWVASSDRDQIDSISAGIESFSGVAPDLLVSGELLWSDLIFMEDRSLVRQTVGDAVNGQRYEIEYRIWRTDRQIRWVSETASLQIYNGLPRLIGVTSDITSRKLSEEAMRKSDTRQRALLNAIPDFMFRLRSDGVFVDFCENAWHPLAPRSHEVIGRRIETCVPQPLATEIMQKVADALRIGEVQSLEYQLRAAVDPGQLRDYEMRFAISGIDEVTAIVRDVTDLQQARRELKKANANLEQRVQQRTADLIEANQRLHDESAERQLAQKHAQSLQSQLAIRNRISSLGELATELAHDINQPLGIIANFASGCLRGLENGTLEMSEVQQSLCTIRRQALHGGEILKRLRSYVGNTMPQPTSFALNDLMQEVVGLMQPECVAKQIQISVSCDSRHTSLFADRTQIQQVLVNLIQNAIEAMIPPMDERVERDQALGCREIQLSAHSNSISSVFRVADSGCGADALVIEKFFEPYVTFKPRGMGLGLSICRTIIVAHGGKITAQANPEGGLTFEFSLPKDLSMPRLKEHSDAA